jgi:hypothetical protein
MDQGDSPPPIVRTGVTQLAQSKASQDSLHSATIHFDRFLREETAADPLLAQRLFNTDSPGSPSFASADRSQIDDHLLDCFARFLALQAKNSRSSDQPIGLNTAERYLSAIKNHLQWEFLGQESCLKTDLKKVRKKMLSLYVDRAKATCQPLSVSRTTMREEDIQGIATLSIWKNVFESANMWLLNVTLKQVAGRGSEVARSLFKNLQLCKPDEFQGLDNNEVVCSFFFWRDKVQAPQNFSLFNHQHDFLQDWYFSLAYSMLMNRQPGCICDNIFPTMSAFRNRTESGREASVSKKYKEVLNVLIRDMKSMLEHQNAESETQEATADNGQPAAIRTSVVPTPIAINSNLSSHSAKRFAVNEANRSPMLRHTWITSWAGWVMKAAHTIYDYLDDSLGHESQCNLYINGWCVPDHLGRYRGGRPPSFNCLNEADDGYSDQIGEAFLRHLFGRYQYVEGASNRQLQFLLIGSVLMHLDTFVQLLLDHPQQRFGTHSADCWETHFFLNFLLSAATNADVPTPCAETLLNWGAKIKSDFHQRNANFVPLSDLLHTQGPEAFVVDTCTIAGFMRSTSSHLEKLSVNMEELRGIFQANSRQLQENNWQIQENSRQIQEATRQLSEVLLLVQGVLRLPNQTQLVSFPGTSDQSADGSCTTNPQPSARKCLPLPDKIGNYTVVDCFVAWHTDAFYNSPGNKHVRNAFKLCVEYLSIFLDKHLDKLPDDGPWGCSAECREWCTNLNKAANDAWEKVLLLGKNEGKKLNGSITGFNNFMKNLDQDKWPNGPDGETLFQPQDERFPMRNRSSLVQRRKRSHDDVQQDESPSS